MSDRFKDHARLVADLKADDAEAIAYAYATVFSGPLGQLVLTHQLAVAGVGSPRGPGLTHGEGRYHDGRSDHALRLLALAGFGPMSAAYAVATDHLEGKDLEPALTDSDTDARSPGFSGPDPAARWE